jgi:hypothetical protein
VVLVGSGGGGWGSPTRFLCALRARGVPGLVEGTHNRSVGPGGGTLSWALLGADLRQRDRIRRPQPMIFERPCRLGLLQAEFIQEQVRSVRI